MLHARSTLIGAIAIAVLSGCGSTTQHPGRGTAAQPSSPTVRQADPAPSRSTLPDEVVVTCSREGIAVSASKVQTRADGVALRIVSSLPRGSYLTYKSAGKGSASGGDPFHRGRQSWTLRLAPGTATLGCDPVGQMGNGQTTTIAITDPGGNWRGTREVDAVGCRGSGIIDWAVGFVDHLDSDRAAAEAVAHEFQTWSARAGQSARFTTRPLAVGYVGDTTQTWLLMKAGAPYATVHVNRTNGHYNAGPDASCTNP